MKPHRTALLLMACLTLSAPVFAAQTTPPPDVKNPSAVVFTPSSDHATIDGYDLDILRPDGSVLQTLNLGKPTPDPNTGDCTAPLNVQPVAFGTGYSVQIRARAGAVSSDNSVSVNKFSRVPGGPGKVTVK
jgi:hypothetical protein